MKKMILVVIVFSFLLSGCAVGNSETPTIDPVAAGVSATMAVRAAVATMMAGITPTATSTELPTPTPSLTPTPVPVIASANQNAICRLGPYKNFEQVTTLSQGDTAEIIGQMDGNGQWWKVNTSGGTECWVSADLVTVNEDTSQIAFLESPPTPTPVPLPPWGGNWSILVQWPGYPDKGLQSFTLTLSQSGNQLTGSFTSDFGKVYLSGQFNPSKPSEVSLSVADEDSIWGSVVLYKDPNNSNQFRGHITNKRTGSAAFCGSRAGAPLPSPCMK